MVSKGPSDSSSTLVAQSSALEHRLASLNIDDDTVRYPLLSSARVSEDIQAYFDDNGRESDHYRRNDSLGGDGDTVSETASNDTEISSGIDLLRNLKVNGVES